MDAALLAWGLRRRPHPLPRLWLFTDTKRLPDPLSAIAALPRGRAGVVFRHDDAAARHALGRAVARICHERRLVLVVAGDVRLAAALRAGLHLRAGRRPAAIRSRTPITSSAHSIPDLLRARRAGAVLIFLSPAFPTASHAGASGLGPARWSRMARRVPGRAAALGGVDGRSVKRLPVRHLRAIGAIGALAAEV